MDDVHILSSKESDPSSIKSIFTYQLEIFPSLCSNYKLKYLTKKYEEYLLRERKQQNKS